MGAGLWWGSAVEEHVMLRNNWWVSWVWRELRVGHLGHLVPLPVFVPAFPKQRNANAFP